MSYELEASFQSLEKSESSEIQKSKNSRFWQLHFYRDGQEESSDCPAGHSLVTLTSLNPTIIAAVVDCTVSKLDNKYPLPKSVSNSCSSKWFSQLHNTCKISTFLKPASNVKKMIIKCTITEFPFNNIKAEDTSDIEYEDIGSFLESLSNLSDFKIYSDDQTTFQVHRAMLAAKSDVFKRMFESEMKESQTGQVEIKDMSSEIVEEILTFIYTGRSPNLQELCNEHSLLLAAEKYELLFLKMLCEIEVAKHITVANVCEELELARQLRCDHLKGECLKFIHGHIDEINNM